MPRYRGQRPDDWTDEELKQLADGPSLRLTMIQVAEKLGRPHSAVKQQASKLGIRYPRQAWGKVQKPWTPEDDALITELAPSTSYRQIGELLGRSEISIRTRTHNLGVRGRSKLEYARSGAEHHRWRGGHRYYRGEDWKEFRQLALERDACTCQDCGLFVPSGFGLVIHHIIPWRLRPVNDLNWLVTLCEADHLRRPEHYWVTIPEDVEAQLRDTFGGAP